jgi:transmembrane sensor
MTDQMTNGRLEVDDLIIRALSGAASQFEVERLKRWREEEPENERYFQERTQVWIVTAPEPLASTSGPPAVEAITGTPQPQRAGAIPGGPENLTGGSEIQAPGPESEKVRRAWSPRASWGLLAASVAALALGVQLLRPGGPEPLATHLAPEGETLTVTLADGSFARLAGGTRLDEWAMDGSREVSLDGRAFFAVVRDETRPFTVRTGEGEVRVMGTRFEVSKERPEEGEEEVRIVVVEGLVVVTNPLGSVEVPAGSVARMNEASAPVAEVAEDVWSLLDWPDGMLVFQATPLAQVAQEVARYFNRSLAVSGETLRGRRVTAWFQGDPFEEVAEALCLVAEAVCRLEGTGVAMEPGVDGGGVR